MYFFSSAELLKRGRNDGPVLFFSSFFFPDTAFTVVAFATTSNAYTMSSTRKCACEWMAVGGVDRHHCDEMRIETVKRSSE